MVHAGNQEGHLARLHGRANHCCHLVLCLIRCEFQVTNVQEVWHYEKTIKGLFADYINKFLKVKTESSGLPAGVTTETEVARYIEDFYEREGIRLETDKIVENPGLRSLAKLCLNSLWGHLGMKKNKSKTEYVNSAERFNELLLSGKYAVSAFDLFSDDIMAVQYKSDADFADINASTNVVVAAFTTSLARLHLYQFMEKLGQNLLYCDTDSVVFVHKPGDYLPPTGNYLGDLTSELGTGEWITSFASLGPKCYGYVTNKGNTCVKVKGHTINGFTKEKLNFENMVRLLSDESVEHIMDPHILKRNKQQLSICQTDMVKQWRVTYDKRYISDEKYSTLPYGY